MATDLFLEPLDVLHLRGNRLFADAGHGEATMPPRPSVFAGALRSRMLVDRGVAFADFLGQRVPDAQVRVIVGEGPDAPGTMRVAGVSLGVRQCPRDPLTTWHPVPADLMVVADGEALRAVRLHPRMHRECGVRGSFELPMVPVPETTERGKPQSGVWMRGDALAAHLRGDDVEPDALCRSSCLWKTDPRLGIGLDDATGSAKEGLLYTADCIALAPGTGFLVRVAGADALLPDGGLVRLGGDGRGATLQHATLAPGHAFPAGVPKGRRFRMLLATPGFFPEGGWLPCGVRWHGDECVLELGGLRARLVAAAVGRAEVASGWDLARGVPKPAVRVAPAGSVYWFDEVEGDPAELARLARDGLGADSTDAELRRRRAEGFNNVWLGEWPDAEG